MAQINWSNTALKDLKTIGEFIKIDSEYYSKIYVQRIVCSIKRLEIFPESGRKSKVFESLGIRELIFENYKILYIYENDTIKILTIVHSKRDL